MFAILAAAFLLYACTPPASSSEGGAPTYHTTVSGKITTPAGKAVMQYNTATLRYEPSSTDAKVWASTAPATKVPVAADGNYTLTVKGHAGTFNIHVSYPKGRDYKAPDPQEVKITAATHRQNIVLNYGYTTTLSGYIVDRTTSGPVAGNDVPIIIEVEDREVDRTVSSGTGANVGSYRITFDHPGTFRAKASFGGREGNYSPARHTGPAATTGTITLR